MRVEGNIVNCDEILNLHANTVYKVALSQVKNEEDAHDIFQDVFVRFIKHNKDFDTQEHVKAWLIRVTINCCKDLFKNHYRSNKQELVVEIPIEDEQHHEVFYLVHELEPMYKDVIHLFYYEQYSIKEISQLLQEKEGTIKTRLVRGRELLKKRMGGD